MAKQKTVPVTSLKLMAGKLPTFPLTVTVKNLDGEEFPIVFTAKAQKKSEWAAIRDAHRKTVDGEDAPAEKAEFSFEDLVKDGMRHAAETVAGAVSGWNLEDEFTVDSLIVLEDQCGGSLAKVLNKYDAALFTGQLGN